jgi:chemosensory pili system protein ChpA (sensor histidine kinase/response regulator)
MEATNQLESLTWVLDEVRKSTGIAIGALAHLLSEKSASLASTQMAGAMASPSNLRMAQNEMRRAVGALKMVGQNASADIFADLGGLIERAGQSPDLVTDALIKSVKSICYSVNAYLSGISGGCSWPASVLVGVAQTAANLAGRMAFHPAQLWVDKGKSHLLPISWQVFDGLEVDHSTADADACLLHLLKGDVASALTLAQMCRDKGKTANDPSHQTLAYCGTLFLISVGKGLTPLTLYVKRSSGRLTQWLNAVNQKDAVAMGLLHELKYFLFSIEPLRAAESIPGFALLLEQGLLTTAADHHDKAEQFRVIDPELLEETQRQLEAAKTDWSELSGGELSASGAAIRHFSGLHQNMLKLWPDLAIVTTTLSRCVQWVSGQNEAPSNGLSLEVATALLFLEDTLADLYSNESGLREKAQAMFSRLELVRSGSAQQGLEPWMEALFRRSSEKQTMGNVAGELRHLAAEIERQFEVAFAASVETTSPLMPPKLQGLLTQMKGVLGVVGLDQGVAAVAHLRATTEVFEHDLRDPRQREQQIANIGSNMASLGLMVDMLSYQPSLANRLFRFDKQSGTLGMLTQSVSRPVVHQESVPLLTDVLVSPAPTQASQAVTRSIPSPLNVGEELKGVFAQEAHDVVEEGLDSVSMLARNAKDIDTLISLRRGFHTLKGSARMVGMNELGNAAWAMEQLLNEQLTNDAQPVSANLCALAKDALDVIGRWSDMLGQGKDPGWTAEPFRLAAQAIRQEGRYLALQMPESEVQSGPKAVATETLLEATDTTGVLETQGPEPTKASQPEVNQEKQEKHVEAQVLHTDFEEDFFLDELEPVSPVKLDAAMLSKEADFSFDLDLDGAVIDSEQYKIIGPLKVRFNLYNVFLQEADEVSRALEVALDEWLLQPDQALPAVAAHYAHTLAGSSATVGFDALADLCRTLESVCSAIRSQNDRRPDLARPLRSAVEAIRFLLHQFAAGFLRQPDPAITRDLLQSVQSEGLMACATPESADQAADSSADELDTVLDMEVQSASFDTVHSFSDQEIWNLFNEEAGELIPHISHHLHAWLKPPHSQNDRNEILRSLHTLKGSARLAGAMPMGDSVHQMESEVEILDPAELSTAQILLSRIDRIAQALDTPNAVLRPVLSDRPQESLTGQLQQTPNSTASDHTQGPVEANNDLTAHQNLVGPPLDEVQDLPPRWELKPDNLPHQLSPVGQGAQNRVAIQRESALATRSEVSESQDLSPVLRQAPVRVNARLLDTVMSRTGEVIGSRARLKLEVDHLRSSLSDLNTNVDKLRAQLRELEIQAESQMQSRLALQKETDSPFDPLEFDRFTRVQELTRMMAESVSDVATVQRQLQRSVDHVDDSLVAQGRQSSDLQRELLRTRMLSFDTLSQRLQRTARQAARDADKAVHLEIEGGNLELDRQQLDRLGPCIEHLIRNAVAHGVETRAQRVQAGKPAEGQIRVSVHQDRNDVLVQVQDDGQGLNLEQIARKAAAAGLADPSLPLSDQQAFDLICLSGFSTAPSVTELAGRGIGMDVVKASVHAAGGRMESLSRKGQGLTVRLVLPLTTATTQVLLVRHGTHVMAIPVNMVEQVLRFGQQDLLQALHTGAIPFGDEVIPFYWAGALLGLSPGSEMKQFRTQPVVVVRSAGRRVAVHVDETVGQQEVIVKSVGGQLSSLPGLTGISVLPAGSIVLIYNPVALALVYGEQVAQFTARHANSDALSRTGSTMATHRPGDAVTGRKLVLVVDDSITVRKVTQRLLERAGYRVALASDGVQALSLLRGELADDLPFIILADIEMPHMDGFDLVRTLGGDARLAALPVVMITSRLAEKHRELATRLGVKHYLGKPFSEDHLLSLVAQYSALADLA